MIYFSASFRLCYSVKFWLPTQSGVFYCGKFNFSSWSFTPLVVFYCCETGSNSFSVSLSLFVHSFGGKYSNGLCGFMFMFIRCGFMKVRALNKFFSVRKKFAISCNPYFISPALCCGSNLAFYKFPASRSLV